MITNPNTLGLFETHLPTVAKMVHEKGGLVYGDGANLNALMGRARPGDLGIDIMQFNLHKTFTTPHGGGGPGCGPVAFKKLLEPFQPRPTVRFADGAYSLDYDRPKSVGRLRSFIGNFGMMVRAYAYIREMGPEGLKAATDLAVLNANYVRARIGEWYPAAFDPTCMHDVIVSDRRLQKETGLKTLDIAKRLIDYGHHPPTVYFPLVVAGAMMIEPTETESKETIDLFIEAMQAIAREAQEKPELLDEAPSTTRLGRLDEARAARKPVLRWKRRARAASTVARRVLRYSGAMPVSPALAKDPAIAGPLGSLALSVVRPAAPMMIVRAIRWYRDLVRLGLHAPLFLVHDLGLLYASPKEQLRVGLRPVLDSVAAKSAGLRELARGVPRRRLRDRARAKPACARVRCACRTISSSSSWRGSSPRSWSAPA